MKKSAGIILYRKNESNIDVLLVHPGGPFWKNKDLGVWSIPKGEFTDYGEPLNAAIREFKEELGSMPTGKFLELTPIKQKSGKIVYAWAVQGEINIANIKSNSFEMEWPPRSGKKTSFPEIDKAEWFTINDAKEKIINAQVSFLNELVNLI